MLRIALGALAMCLVLPVAGAPAAAVGFEATVVIDSWDEQVDGPGLDIEVTDVAMPLAFSLDPGQSITLNPFRIRTTQAGADDAADQVAKPFTMRLDFTLPFVFSVEVSGITQSGNAGTGNRAGFLRWSGQPQQVFYGVDGELEIQAFDRLFNEGFLGLNNPGNPGSFVPVRFELVKEATVPEPGVATLLLAAAVLCGRAARSRAR